MSTNHHYEVWASLEARWSSWVKPVLFAWLKDWNVPPVLPELSTEWDCSWLADRRQQDDTVLVLDLPGAEGVAAGLLFMSQGFRPVPLYNAVPMAEPGDYASLTQAPPLVDVISIIRALEAGTPWIEAAALPPDASPAFLLDSNRRAGSHPLYPGYFDNRSVSFPTDFPSANFLLSHGIRRVILVQRNVSFPASDLAHTLYAWQEAGLVIEVKHVESSNPPVTIQVRQPHLFGRWFYRALEMMGFRRHTLGGFGGVLPDPSSGG